MIQDTSSNSHLTAACAHLYYVGKCVLLRVFIAHRHNHQRYVEVKLRITKTGQDTSDVMTLRLFSFFCDMSKADKEDESITAYVQCPGEHLNIPQLLQPLILFACSAPGVRMDMGVISEQPLFPSLSVRNVAGTVTFFKMKSETEVNARFAADLSRIGRDLCNGDRVVRMYGFRRGGAQALLDRTGPYEQVMRLGGWQPNSNSFFTYIVGSRAHRISAASHCTSAAFLRPSHFRKLRTTGLQMSSYVSIDAWILCKAMSPF